MSLGLFSLMHATALGPVVASLSAGGPPFRPSGSPGSSLARFSTGRFAEGVLPWFWNKGKSRA